MRFDSLQISAGTISASGGRTAAQSAGRDGGRDRFGAAKASSPEKPDCGGFFQQELKRYG